MRRKSLSIALLALAAVAISCASTPLANNQDFKMVPDDLRTKVEANTIPDLLTYPSRELSGLGDRDGRFACFLAGRGPGNAMPRTSGAWTS